MPNRWGAKTIEVNSIDDDTWPSSRLNIEPISVTPSTFSSQMRITSQRKKGRQKRNHIQATRRNETHQPKIACVCRTNREIISRFELQQQISGSEMRTEMKREKYGGNFVIFIVWTNTLFSASFSISKLCLFLLLFTMAWRGNEVPAHVCVCVCGWSKDLSIDEYDAKPKYVNRWRRLSFSQFINTSNKKYRSREWGKWKWNYCSGCGALCAKQCETWK